MFDISGADSNQMNALIILFLLTIYIVIMNFIAENGGHNKAMAELNRERISEGLRPIGY